MTKDPGAQQKTVDHYMGLPYAVEIRSDEPGWFARVSELPGCVSWAGTLEELGPKIEDAKRGWIEDALERGAPIPEPSETTRTRST